MTLGVFLAALVGGMLIGIPVCFALMFSGVCMMLFLMDSILRSWPRTCFPVPTPSP